MADEPENRQDEAPAEKPAAEKARKAKAKPKQKEKAAPKAEAKPKPARRARRKKAPADAPSEPVAANEVAEPVAADAVQVAEPADKKADEQAAAATRPAPSRSRGAYAGVRPVVRAHAKYVRTSARKARLVCDHIRGRSVAEARAILLHTNRQVAEDWSKLLESAVANAEHNHELIGEDLRIAFVRADEGPTLKRFRPRAMGRATKIRKRTSHLSIGLEPKR